MKFILSILAMAFVLFAAGAAIGSDLENEWDGDWSYECSFLRDRVSARKVIRADDKSEAECKVSMWAAKNRVNITNASCKCAGEAGCE